MSETPGRIGPYEIVRRLGSGGMAEVFEARRRGPHGFEKRVALKRVLPNLTAKSASVDMFIEEAALAGSLEHPNIVHVFDFGEDDGQLYLTMELVEGTSVNKILRVLAARGETVPLEVALDLVGQTALALQYAHRRRDGQGRPLHLVHRDVSPSNLLVTPEGTLKLADFGIARTELRERHTDDRNLRGKIGYMSPEQVTGRPLDDRSDIFTLTTILAELLLGETLFSRGTDLDVLIRIRDVNLAVLDDSERRIPGDVRALLMAGLSHNPADRPSARSFAQAVEAILFRRGLARGAREQTARLLFRYELVDGAVDEQGASEPGARPTALVGLDGTAELSAGVRASRMLSELRGRAVPMYTPILDGQRPVGDVPFPELVRLTTTGCVDAGVPVSKDGAPAVLACQLPELSRIFETPALQWRDDELGRPQMRGELSAAVLLPIIHSLYAKRSSGVLHLQDGARRKKVYFVDGHPDFVASNVRREMLGDYLVDEEHCLSMELDMGLALLPRYGGRLGDALVDLGVLRPVELYRAVSSQVRARYLDTFRWRQGQWSFIAQAQSGEETYPIENDAQVLMRDAARELDPSELEAALTPMWERVIGPGQRPAAALGSYQLPDEWNWVINEAQGEDTVGSLFARSTMHNGLDEEAAMRAMFLGVSCGLLRAA